MHIQSRLGGLRPAMVASLWDPCEGLCQTVDVESVFSQQTAR